jgi:hypothetical protein
LKSKEFIEFLYKKNIRKEAVIARVKDSLAVTQGVGFPKLGKESAKVATWSWLVRVEA